MSTSSPIPKARAPGRRGPLRLKLPTRRSALTPYDRFVALMRLVLPGFAGAIALTALALPLLSDRDRGYTFNRNRLAAHADKIRVLDARYTGSDLVGRLFHLTAEAASQDGPEATEIALERLSADLRMDGNERARVMAPAGIYYSERRHLSVTGGMDLMTTTGYALATETAEVDLNRQVARSDDPVTGQSPLGRFQANGFVLYVEDRIARLAGGVEMRVDPAAVGSGAQDDRQP